MRKQPFEKTTFLLDLRKDANKPIQYGISTDCEKQQSMRKQPTHDNDFLCIIRTLKCS
jgi:hypothetical protein